LIAKTVQVTEKELNSCITDLLKQITGLNNDIYTSNSYRKLSEYLICPLSEYLDNKKIIYFVPHRNLHYLPIHSLDNNGNPLVCNYATSYLPNVSVLKFVHAGNKRVPVSCSAFAVPKNERDRASIENEAKYVAQMFNSKPFLFASKATFINNLKKDVLHLSCHANFDFNDPLSSGVRLSDGCTYGKRALQIRVEI
jgi:CHAT domain-containing protein